MWDAKTVATDQAQAEDGKTLRHLQEELNRVCPDDGNQRESKIARFSEDHGFACGFIVTVYARFSIESLASAAKIVFRLFPMRRLERRSVEHSVQENQKARAMPVTWRTQIA
jgi:hypothetical protein